MVPAVHVSTTFIITVHLVSLVGIEVRSVHGLDVFSQRAGVSVTLGTAESLTYVRLLNTYTRTSN